MAGRGRKRGAADNGFADWGGYMSAKISKLENQYLASAANNHHEEDNPSSRIFDGVAIFVNGYTVPSAEELKRLMMTYGGIFHHYFNSVTTTHIIATNLPDTKVKQLKGNEKIVKPDWIVESIKNGKLLDYRPYLLYTASMEKGQQKLQMPQAGTKQAVTKPDKTDKPPKPDIEDESSVTNSKRHLRAGEDNFLSEFYNRSRLHHISTMGAMFKRYVTELREKSNNVFVGIDNLKLWKKERCGIDTWSRSEIVIMHIDMDCFFVSVGLRNHPELRGQPVVVTHARAESKPQHRPGSSREFEFDCYKEHWIKKHDGTTEDMEQIFPRLENLDESCSMAEIASCSYEARKAGIYNGMFLGAALKLCPNIKTIPYDFEGYKEVSFGLYDTIASYSLDIEAVSCDEMYVNITSILRDVGITPGSFAAHIREVIHQKTGCTASVGMGPSLLLARLATKKAKPDGFFWVPSRDTEAFMTEQKVDDLPGVGRSSAFRLRAMGCQTCGEMQKVPLGRLQQEFGPKQGQTLFAMCRGEDNRELKTGHIRKSVSAEVNYGIRFTSDQETYKFTLELCEEVSKRMEEAHVKGRLLTLKLKIRSKDAPIETAKFMGHGVCDSLSKSVTFPVATKDSSIIHKEAMSLLRQVKVESSELRGMGVQMSKLEPDSGKGKQLAGGSILSFMGNRTGKAESIAEKKPRMDYPSEIDRSVFDQLPDEVKEDILNSYNLRGDQVPFKAPPPRAVHVDESSCDSQASTINSIRSVEDIDPDCWLALPDDIREEIRNEIQRKKEHSSPKKEITTRPSSKVLKWTAAKTEERKSPLKKRGRPSKAAMASKRIESGLKQQQLNFSKRNQVKAEPEKVKEPPKETSAVSDVISLGGCSSEQQISSLLRQWIDSGEEPLDEDAAAVTEYLVKVVRSRNLEKVSSTMRTICRLTRDKGPRWKQAVEQLTNEVQVHVIELYNAPLKF